MTCRKCGMVHDNGRGKCPRCDVGARKHAVAPRELLASIEQVRCPHGILRHRPCWKCGREDEDCAAYRQHILTVLQKVYLIQMPSMSRSDAWGAAKLVLAGSIDVREAEQSK
jgi:hypothetical protein